MHRQHVAPQSQNERTRSLIRGAKRRTGAKIAAFGVSALAAGQLLLPGVALATEIPEPTTGKDIAVATIAGSVEPGVTKQAAETAAAAPNAAESSAVKAESPSTPALASETAPTAALNAAEPAAAVALASESATAPEPATAAPNSAAAPAARSATTPGGGEIRVNTTVVNHFYDLELPPAFTLVQDEAFVYDFPDAPEGFTLWRNESVHLFRIDPDTESLVKTEDAKEANVSISLASVDNHERATLVFTGGDADPLISYSLNLFHTAHIGAFADPDFSNFNNGEGTILVTRHEYYLRCVFGSNVYLIGTDTTDPEPGPDAKPNPEVKPDPEVKPAPETKPDPAPQPEVEKPATDPAPAKAAPVAKPAETALPATGDNGATAIALGAAGAAAAAAAAAGVAATRRRNR